MSTQLTTRNLLRVTLCTLALGSPAWAGGGFFEDFHDGNIQDDTPVTWLWNANGGQCTVTPEGLQFKPSQLPPWVPATWLMAFAQKGGTDVQYTGNMSIRAQLNIGSGRGLRGCVTLRTSDTNVVNGGYCLFVGRDVAIHEMPRKNLFEAVILEWRESG